MSEDLNEIYEEKPDHHYRTEIPNIVYQLGISLPAIGLYGYLKNTAGDSGSCWKKQTTICEEVGISPATYIKYRDELANSQPKLGGKSLLYIQIRKKPDGSNDTTKISIVNIWRENGNLFRSKKDNAIQNMNEVVQNLNEGHSISECKQEPFKKNRKNNDVDVPICLKNMGISIDLQISLTEKYGDDPKRIENACIAVSKMKPRNMEATIQAALQGSYTPPVEKEDIEAANKEWTEINLRKYDNTQVGPLRCDIIPGGLQFSGANSNIPRTFSYEDVEFKEEVTKLMNKLLKI
jgi:hypothetical protein